MSLALSTSPKFRGLARVFHALPWVRHLFSHTVSAQDVALLHRQVGGRGSGVGGVGVGWGMHAPLQAWAGLGLGRVCLSGWLAGYLAG
jgi:hypothetical protein